VVPSSIKIKFNRQKIKEANFIYLKRTKENSGE